MIRPGGRRRVAADDERLADARGRQTFDEGGELAPPARHLRREMRDHLIAARGEALGHIDRAGLPVRRRGRHRDAGARRQSRQPVLDAADRYDFEARRRQQLGDALTSEGDGIARAGHRRPRSGKRIDTVLFLPSVRVSRTPSGRAHAPTRCLRGLQVAALEEDPADGDDAIDGGSIGPMAVLSSASAVNLRGRRARQCVVPRARPPMSPSTVSTTPQRERGAQAARQTQTPSRRTTMGTRSQARTRRG